MAIREEFHLLRIERHSTTVLPIANGLDNTMMPHTNHALLAAQVAAAEEARKRRHEEEALTPYSEADLEQHWQFKIVTGNFSTLEKVQAVIQEQADWGWVFVEKFDNSRIRFKRPASEADRDASRSGDPYATNSKAASGCATAGAVLLVVVSGLCWLVASVV